MGIDFIAEWAAHSGEAPEAVEARIRNYLPMLRAEWAGFFPDDSRSSAADALRFYRQSLICVYDHLGRAHWQQHEKWPQECARQLREVADGAGCRTVLDFGCGVGAMGLGLAQQGFEITLAEIAGARHYPFLFRLAAQAPGIRIRQAEVALSEDEGPWDAIVFLEVLEHLPRPEVMARRLVAKLRPGGILFASWSFGQGDGADYNPLHLDSGWTDEQFQLFCERVCGLEWLNPGPCWARILRKEH